MEEDLVLPNVEAADSSDGDALALDELSARAFDEMREAHIPPVKLEITGAVPRLKWGDPRIVSFIDEEVRTCRHLFLHRRRIHTFDPEMIV